jgi:predicted dehydrogenase
MPALLANPEFKVVGVVDRHEARAKEAAREFGLPRWAEAESLAAVSWLDEIQAVTIGTPPASHALLLQGARSAGIHVLTEKPFTLAMSDATAAAAPGGSVVAVMHNFQFARSAQRLWRDLSSGVLGEIRGVEAFQWSSRDRRLPEWYEQLPLGLFFDESPHLLYLLRRMTPDLQLESANIRESPHGRSTPSAVWALYSSGGPNPFPMVLSLNFDTSVSEWQFVVHGANGAAIVDLFRDIYIRLPRDGNHGSVDVLRTSWAATFGHWKGVASSGYLHARGRLRYGVDEVVRRFGDAILIGEDPAECGRTDALAVRAMQEAILASGGVSTAGP